MKHIDTRLEQRIKRTESVNKFFGYMRNYSHYSPQEQVDMCIRAQQGSQKDREELVTSNLSFIFSVCARYAEGDEILSLISYAVEGMYKAIDKFNSTYGITFLSYAVYWIQRYIMDYYFGTQPFIRNKKYLKYSTKIIRVTEELTKKLERQPTADEISEELFKVDGINFDKEDIINVNYSYLDDILTDDVTVESGETFSNLTAQENGVEDVIKEDYYKDAVAALLQQLPERDRIILQMSYGIGYKREYSDSEIAPHFDLTAERVRQIRKTSLTKLRVRNLKKVQV